MLQGDSTASTSTSEVHHHASSAVDEGEEDVTLSTLLTRSIVAAEDLLDRAHELSSSKAAQGRLDSTLANLSLCSSLISHLNLLSANETLDELATSTIRCFLVPYYAGLLELQRRTRDYKSRAEALAVSQTNLESFVKQCDDYGVLSQDRRRTLHLTSASSSSADPSRRREAKIAQYKEERALKSRIEVSVPTPPHCPRMIAIVFALGGYWLADTQAEHPGCLHSGNDKATAVKIRLLDRSREHKRRPLVI